MVRAHDDRLLVWALVASQFGPPFMFSGVAVALPSLGADLGAGATTLGLVETLFLAGSLAFLLPVGRLADAADKRALYKLGLLAFGGSSALIALLSSVPAILVLRFAQGLASALFSVTGPAILADVVPLERRGRVYGASMGALYAGLTLGPIAAGVLVRWLGWRAVFATGALAILAGLEVVRRRLPSTWRWPAGAVHGPSAVLVVAAVLSLVGGTATLRAGAGGGALLVAGALLAAVFAWLQPRLPAPLVDVAMLRRAAVLRRALLAQMLIYMNAYCSVFMLSLFLQVTLGQPADRAGRVLAAGTLLMAVMAPLAGRLAERYAPQRLAAFGVAVVLASAVVAMGLDRGSSPAAVAVVLLLQGLGFAFFSSPNMTAIMNSVGAGSVSMASAMASKARGLGMTGGMLMTAVLIALDMGNDPVQHHPARLADTVRVAFTLLAVTGVLALVVALRGARPPRRHDGAANGLDHRRRHSHHSPPSAVSTDTATPDSSPGGR